MIKDSITSVIDKTDEDITTCVINNETLYRRLLRKYPKRNIILRDASYLTKYMIGLSTEKKSDMLFITGKDRTYLYEAH